MERWRGGGVERWRGGGMEGGRGGEVERWRGPHHLGISRTANMRDLAPLLRSNLKLLFEIGFDNFFFR